METLEQNERFSENFVGIPRAVLPVLASELFTLEHEEVEWGRAVTARDFVRHFGGRVVEKREELLDPEDALLPRRRRGNPAQALPRAGDVEELRDLAGSHGAGRFAVEQAAAMFDAGLEGKAVRLVLCGRLGRRVECSEGHGFFVRCRCQNRYCRSCMTSVFQALFAALHVRLAPVAQRLVPVWPVRGHLPRRVVAKVDFTVPNPGRMAKPEEVRRFNRDVRRFFLALARRLGWCKGKWGAAWCCEFGPGNTNLHAHGVFCGPWIPQQKKEASTLWGEIRGERSFMSVKAAHSFEHALRHAIKYPAADWKHFNSTPERMAALEVAFHGTRRVHAVGAFYNPPDAGEEVVPGGLGCCPHCNSPLYEPMEWRWQRVSDFEGAGVRELDSVRRELGRSRVLSATGPP